MIMVVVVRMQIVPTSDFQVSIAAARQVILGTVTAALI
jgi:hypothetical protein